MLIHNYSILQFNSNNAHQVAKIGGITKEESNYFLKVWFIEVFNTESIHTELTNTEERYKFKNGSMFLRKVSISLARYFVLGSYWWNDQKPLLSETTSQTKINDDFILHSKIASVDASQYLENITLHFSDLICYELNKSLFYHKKQKNTSQLSFKSPNWKNKYAVDFIIFPSSEIYRYFFTSFGINSVNEWLLNPNFFSHYFDERAAEKKNMDKNTFPVFLNHKSNFLGTPTIGNCLNISEFISQLRLVQKGLTVEGSCDFKTIASLPLKQIESMEVIGKKVNRKSDGKSGLLVQQLKSCLGYTSNIYKPFFPKVENTEAGEKRNFPSPNNNDSDTEDTNKPNLNYGHTTNDNSPSVKIDLLDIDALTETNDDIKQLDAGEFEAAQIDFGGYYNPKDPNNEISFPGKNSSGGGKKISNAESIDVQDFFKDFPKVVKQLEASLKEYGFTTTVNYYSENGLFNPTPLKVETEKLKQLNLKGKWYVYAAQIEVIKFNREKRNFLYLFEKKRIKSEKSNRLLLYSPLGFVRISESDFQIYIRAYILSKKKKPKVDEQAIYHRFNSLQTSEDKQIDPSVSIESQGIKIADFINKSFK